MIKLIRSDYPAGSDTQNFLSAYPAFEDELYDILDHSGNKETFVCKYNQRLDWVRNNRERCHLKREWCEQIKYDPENYLYSLKIKGEQNIRILFIFYTASRIPILLCAFKEIAKGRKSSKIYAQYMDMAHKRVNELILEGLIKKEEIICHN